MGIIQSILLKHHSHPRPRPASPSKSSISHPFPLGTQIHTQHSNMGESSRPISRQSRRSTHGLKRGLSGRKGRMLDENADGFRRLLSPSPLDLNNPIGLDNDEGQEYGNIHSRINPERLERPRSRLKKVIKVDGDWDLIRSSDLDGLKGKVGDEVYFGSKAIIS